MVHLRLLVETEDIIRLEKTAEEDLKIFCRFEEVVRKTIVSFSKFKYLHIGQLEQFDF